MNSIPHEVEELKYWATILFEILEVNKRPLVEKKDNWIFDSEPLVQKVALHTLSTLDLLEGTKPHISTIKTNINFIDYLSIHAIVRSALEAYLVLHYVFLDYSVSKRVKIFRHKIWHASSLSQRQKQQVATSRVIKMLKREKSEYLRLRRQILRSKTFAAKISLQQIHNLEKKRPFDWKPSDGWRGIAKNAPISEYFWIDVYNFLSSTVHSNAVVTNQLHNKKDPKDIQEGMALTAVQFLNLVIPLFISGYASLFPKVKFLVTKNQKLSLNVKVAEGVVKGYKP